MPAEKYSQQALMILIISYQKKSSVQLSIHSI